MTDHRIRKSRKQEADGARRFGGKVNSGSGNGEIFKSDLRTDDELIEMKTTAAASFRLKVSELHTAWQHALLDGRRMIFGIEFQNLPEDSNYGAPLRFVLLEEDEYLSMRGKLDNAYGVGSW